MRTWTDREKLINEYRRDLKDLKRQHNAITSKRYTYKVKDHSKEVSKIHDDRTAEELSAQKTLAEAIDSTEYALFWLINGHERRFDEKGITDLSKEQRTQYWGDIKELESYYKLTNEVVEVRELTDDEQQVLTEVLGLLDMTEKDVFISIYAKQNTEEETANYLNMTKSAVKYYKKRVQKKIYDYNNIGYQLSFC